VREEYLRLDSSPFSILLSVLYIFSVVILSNSYALILTFKLTHIWMVRSSDKLLGLNDTKYLSYVQIKLDVYTHNQHAPEF